MRRLIGRLRADRGDEGYTLAELLVTMIILGIVSIIVGGVFISGTRTVSAADSVVSETQTAQVVADHLTSTLRAATNLPTVMSVNGVATNGVTPGFLISAPFEAKFYSYFKVATGAAGLTAGPSLIDEKVVQSTTNLNNWELVETVTPAVGTAAPYTYPASGTVTRVLANGLAPTASAPSLFTYDQPLYYQVAGNGNTCSLPLNNTPPTLVAAVGAGTAYVGVQSAQFGAASAPAVSNSIGTVALNITVSSNGVNAPAYSSTTRTTTVQSTVTLDDANSPDSRPGTCL